MGKREKAIEWMLHAVDAYARLGDTDDIVYDLNVRYKDGIHVSDIRKLADAIGIELKTEIHDCDYNKLSFQLFGTSFFGLEERTDKE